MSDRILVMSSAWPHRREIGAGPRQSMARIRAARAWRRSPAGEPACRRRPRHEPTESERGGAAPAYSTARRRGQGGSPALRGASGAAPATGLRRPRSLLGIAFGSVPAAWRFVRRRSGCRPTSSRPSPTSPASSPAWSSARTSSSHSLDRDHRHRRFVIGSLLVPPWATCWAGVPRRCSRPTSSACRSPPRWRSRRCSSCG
jgi:hypothetical protein